MFAGLLSVPGFSDWFIPEQKKRKVLKMSVFSVNLYTNEGVPIDSCVCDDICAAEDWLRERLTPSLYGEILQDGEIISECSI